MFVPIGWCVANEVLVPIRPCGAQRPSTVVTMCLAGTMPKKGWVGTVGAWGARVAHTQASKLLCPD